MLSDDYLIRMIRRATTILARIIGLQKVGDYYEALKEIDQALEQVLGMDIEIIKIMDDESIYRILTQNEQMDLERLGFIADLFTEEGNILLLQNQKQQSDNYYLSSLNYYLKIGLCSETLHQKELSQKVGDLIHELGNYNYPNRTLFDLFCYYENNGEYANADNILAKLATHPEVKSDIRSEMMSFYRRLLEINPKELTAGGMSLEQIKSKLEGLE